MRYDIRKFRAPSTALNPNDKIIPDRYGDSGEYDTEDAYPVVVMETGIRSSDGTQVYHDKRGITGPAKTWDEAVNLVRLGEGERFATCSPLHGTLCAGNEGIDFWVVEVLVFVEEETV